MEIITVSDTVVVIASFITPIIIAPQIYRIIKLKEAEAISFLTSYGSLFLQLNLFFNAYLHSQPQVMISMALSFIPLIIFIVLVHYYRHKRRVTSV